MKTCSSCNAEVPGTAQKCPRCGQSLLEIDVPSSKKAAAAFTGSSKGVLVCPACGERALPRQTRCLKCNTRLQVLQAAWEGGGAEPIPFKADDSSPAGVCPSCGLPLAPGSVLCIDCGFDKRKGRRLESAHRAEEQQDEGDVEPIARRRRTGSRQGPRIASTVAIGLGAGLLFASLYIIPVLIQGPLLELANGRKVPWPALVSWPFVAVSALVLILGLVMRSR